MTKEEIIDSNAKLIRLRLAGMNVYRRQLDAIEKAYRDSMMEEFREQEKYPIEGQGR